MIEQLNEKYWSNRYLQKQTGWDIGTVANPLKEYFDQLKIKSCAILIPGAGNAYEAEYLVEHGFQNVFVCDLAQEPLDNLAKRCPKLDQKNLIKADFFDLSPSEHQYDIIVEQTFFCALDPSLRKNYFVKMKELLKPGGKLIGLLFDCSFEVSPPFGGTKEEYEKYFSGLFKVKKFELCYNSIAPRQGREIFMILENV